LLAWTKGLVSILKIGATIGEVMEVDVDDDEPE
jgi:hypothetical protein